MTLFTNLETLLVSLLPAITAIATIITAYVKIKQSLGQLKENESLKQERDALIEQNKVATAELRQTKKMIALYLEKATHIALKDMSEVKNDTELQN